MQNRVLLAPFYLIAATFIGLGDALFLAYYQYLDLVPGCAIGGCEVVLTSSYASILGVHLSYFGLVYYGYMLGLAVLLAIDPYSKGLRFGALLYTGVGLLCSLIFEGIQFFIIGSLCMYCGISAITTLVLFCLAVWHYRTTRITK
jgi:uncharacterized membrane protein